MALLLIIEDEKIIRENCKELLEMQGYTCIEAGDGKLGLELAVQNKPDAIICDISLPFLNGYEIKSMLNLDENTADIPFIFLTAKTERQDQRMGMELGAFDFITKPFKINELYKTILRVLEKKRQLENTINNQVSNSLIDFVHVAKHECNTPLHAIINLSQLLKDSNHTSNFEKIVSSINTSGKRLQKTLNNLIDLVRLRHYYEEGFFPEKEQVDVMMQFGNQILHFERLYTRKIILKSNIKQQYVQFYQEDFEIIIIELLHNAIKFSEGNDVVGIQISANELLGLINLSFFNRVSRDFEPFEISEIAPFKQFKKVENGQQGSGLGLYLVLVVCEKYNCRLTTSKLTDTMFLVEVSIPARIFN